MLNSRFRDAGSGRAAVVGIHVNKMLEIDRGASIPTSSKISVPLPVVIHQRRPRLSSVPLVELGQQASSKAGCTSYPVITRRHSITSPRHDSENTFGLLKGGICSVSDTMESLRGGGGNSPISPPNVRIKHLTRNQEGSSRFPKLDEGAHFHYENVELGPIKVCVLEERPDISKAPSLNGADKENEGGHCWFSVQVSSNSRGWMIRRSYDNFRILDRQLHRCVYDRKYSLLQELPAPETVVEAEREERFHAILTEYLNRFSQLAGSLINCGTVLNWLELDNRGNRLIVTDEAAINTPAVAAAYVIKRYSAQASDEISFEVGDMVSVIDMPPPEESTWWRGKKGFEVGFFPCECVEIIGDKVPQTLKVPKAPSKPVLRKHGKLIAFFRSFLLSRPSRKKLKQSGILKERVFGCDLGEHLMNTGRDIPLVLKCCAEFIERHGIADGIYRLSGVTSNIQKLRVAFDEDRIPDLKEEAIIQDIHCVASLLKMYFRELPNPLLTYQLYEKFVTAVQSDDDVRLLRLRDIVQQLPPPHYRTLEYLMKHLTRVAAYGQQTGMTPKNVAIVWAPNLLRSKDLEGGGVGALHVVGVQAVLTEYLIRYSDLLFSEKMPVFHSPVPGEGTPKKTRPKSLAISTPTKLLSLEEARSRALSANLPHSHQKYIDVGGGPKTLPLKYHTVIDLPNGKRSGSKLKKSPSGWKSFFQRSGAREKERGGSGRLISSPRKISTGSLPYNPLTFQHAKAITETDFLHNSSKKLRTVKSAESLISSLGGSASGRNSGVLDATSFIPVDMGKFSWHTLEYSPEENPNLCQCSISKSPSIHRHIRSISHDSYFEHVMDPIEEQEMDADDESVFQLYQEMEDIIDGRVKMDLHHLDTNSLHLEIRDGHGLWDRNAFPNRSSIEMRTREHPMESNTAVQNSRKQKLHSSDSDVGSPKVQKLNNNRCTSKRSNSARNIETFLPKSAHWAQACDTWKEGMESEMSDRTLKVDEQAAENAEQSPTPNNRTIVERYGNEETVLVEVHATQDVSSDDEIEIGREVTEKSNFPLENVCMSESSEFSASTAEEMIRSIAPSLFARDSSAEDSELYSGFSVEGTISDTPSVHKSFDTPDQCLLLENLPYEPLSLLSPTGIDTSLSTPESPTMANISEMPSSASGSDVSEPPENVTDVGTEEKVFTKQDSSHSEHLKYSSKEQTQDGIKAISAHPSTNTIESPGDILNDSMFLLSSAPEYQSKDDENDAHHVLELTTVVNKTVRFQLNHLEILGDDSETSLETVELENQTDESDKEGMQTAASSLKYDHTHQQKPSVVDIPKLETHENAQEEANVNRNAARIAGNVSNSHKHFLDDTKLQSLTVHVGSDLLKRRSFAERVSPVSPFDDSRRKFESEIGRTIVRDHQMRLEMEQIQAEGQKNALSKGDSFNAGKTKPEMKDLQKSCEFPPGRNSDKKFIDGVELRRSQAWPMDTTTEQDSLEKKRSSEPSVKPDVTISAEIKRHSEPLNIPKYKLTEKKSVKDLLSKFETPGHQKEHIESEAVSCPVKPSVDESPTKPKSTHPSLFTQLKVMKLQSLHSGTSPTDAPHSDPWSDPILDLFEKSENEKLMLVASTPEMHPLVDTSNFTISEDFVDRKMNPPRPQTLDLVSSKMHQLLESEKENVGSALLSPASQNGLELGVCHHPNTNISTSIHYSVSDAKHSSPQTASPITPDENVELDDKSPFVEEELDAIRRERINRYKEERRAQLQEKLKTESFRVKAEEKEKVQSQFRIRKNSKPTSPLGDEEPRRRSLSPKKGIRSPVDASSERSKSSPGTPVRDNHVNKSDIIFDWTTDKPSGQSTGSCVTSTKMNSEKINKGPKVGNPVKQPPKVTGVHTKDNISMKADGSNPPKDVPIRNAQKSEPSALMKSGSSSSKAPSGVPAKCIRERAAIFECPKDSASQHHHQRPASTVSRH